jgi:hypothetical protein
VVVHGNEKEPAAMNLYNEATGKASRYKSWTFHSITSTIPIQIYLYDTNIYSIPSLWSAFNCFHRNYFLVDRNSTVIQGPRLVGIWLLLLQSQDINYLIVSTIYGYLQL